MSKEINDQYQSEPDKSASEIDKKIAAFRQRLAIDASTWPQTADTLFVDLAISVDEMGDDAMLELVVQDALRGVDIPRKYPHVYRRLLSNSNLRQTFLDLLTALEPNQEQSIPPMPKTDLSFLTTAASPQATVHTSKSGWRASWQLFSNHLTSCFPAPQTLVYRSAYDDLLEEKNVILLENEFSVNELQLNILLEANLEAEHPDTPTLSLSVAALSGQQLPALQAILTWGSYQAMAVLDRYGMAHFPRLELASVFDKTGQAIRDDLQLVLESISA